MESTKFRFIGKAAATVMALAVGFLGSRPAAAGATEQTTGGGHSAKAQEQLLYSFTNSPGDDHLPHAGLVRDGAGNLYGTTGYGGAYVGGTVFEVTP